MNLTDEMITPEQKKKIHTLLTKHKVEDKVYREILEKKFQVDSSIYLDEEQASNLIEYLIEITGDTYDRENNTEYYQRKCGNYKENLIKSTIHAFAETMTKEQILQMFLSVTTTEQNKVIVQMIMK